MDKSEPDMTAWMAGWMDVMALYYQVRWWMHGPEVGLKLRVLFGQPLHIVELLLLSPPLFMYSG